MSPVRFLVVPLKICVGPVEYRLVRQIFILKSRVRLPAGLLWSLSSAGSERLPYKQRVGGSNPSATTILYKVFPAKEKIDDL